MKVAPVSADLLIKLALAAAAVGVVYYAWRKISAPVGNVLDGLGNVADATIAAINPADPENLVNRAVTAVGGAIVSNPEGPGKNADGSWTLGGFIYDVTHPEVTAQIKGTSSHPDLTNYNYF